LFSTAQTLWRSRSAFAALLAVAALGACSLDRERPEPAAATAGDLSISRSDIEAEVESMRRSATRLGSHELRREAAVRALRRRLFAREALARGLDRSPELARELQQLDERIAMDVWTLQLGADVPVDEAAVEADLAPFRGRVDAEQLAFRRRELFLARRAEAGVSRRIEALDELERQLEIRLDGELLRTAAEVPATSVVASSGQVDLLAYEAWRFLPRGHVSERLPMAERERLLRHAVTFRVLAQRKAAEGLHLLPEHRARRQADREAVLARALEDDELERSLAREPLDPEAYYRAHLDELQKPEEVRARHILIAHREVPGARSERGREEAAALAAQLVGLLRAGERFEPLARRHSDLVERSGELGWFQRDGMLTPALADAAFLTEPGGIADPVQTRHGYHVLEVLERRFPGAVPFAEVAGTLEARLRAERRREAIEALERRLGQGHELLLQERAYFGL
jgi:parvulin-like peptidyl-prolyl isomerase